MIRWDPDAGLVQDYWDATREQRLAAWRRRAARIFRRLTRRRGSVETPR